jgi:hypothetical protein
LCFLVIEFNMVMRICNRMKTNMPIRKYRSLRLFFFPFLSTKIDIQFMLYYGYWVICYNAKTMVFVTN